MNVTRQTGATGLQSAFMAGATVLVMVTVCAAESGDDQAGTAVIQVVLRAPGGQVADTLPHVGLGLARLDAASEPAPRVVARGAGWEPMSLPGGVYLQAISMGSAQVGFAAGELGIVLRTTNGGSTWDYVLNQGFPYYYYGVHAFSEDTAIATGFDNQTGDGILRWTDDGGDTWDPIVTLTAPTFFDWAYYVRFADDNRGIIQAWGGAVHYTTNGGRTADDWTSAQPTENWWQGPFTFLDDGRAWMSGFDNFRSPDDGTTWSPIADADPLFDGANSVLSNGNGFIAGGVISPSVAGWVYGTEDGGDSWTPAPILETPYPVRAVLRLGDELGWAVGGNIFTGVGGLWKTEDGGTNWDLDVDTGNEMKDIDWVRVDDQYIDVYVAGYISQIWRTRLEYPLEVPTCEGDANGDGVVNPLDSGFVLARFGCSVGTGDPSCDAADQNGDGLVDPLDSGFVLARFGPCE